ncbi:flagellar basal body L-ring protein FlgH [Flavisphingomonas formosensis]|uniref:flagellar basal body L-ring protein FlgH n=1 Tax=Flavisphingomonas formosensis TaxID=861534 RepID=UPI0012F9D9DF|nr:flagellar basal body L-ring protein FlgH [Sphingomonas formosensis]
MKRRGWLCLLVALASPATATDLYARGNWAALASDRIAREPGDAITILVYESATATNSANTGSRKGTSLSGSVHGPHFDKSAGLDMGGSSQANGTTGRSGQMVAQISALVESVLPNGDLIVAGQQEMRINGERTHIKVRGRVRLADVSASNAVLSTRLADAMIDYDGTGFVSRSGKPGIITRVFNWLGIL